MNPVRFNPMRSKRAAAWLAGMFLLIGGYLGAAILLPFRVEPYGSRGPEIQLPNMERVPPQSAPRLELQLPPEPQDET